MDYSSSRADAISLISGAISLIISYLSCLISSFMGLRAWPPLLALHRFTGVPPAPTIANSHANMILGDLILPLIE
jgi:hypothetical protein